MLACACVSVASGYILGIAIMAVLFKRMYIYELKPEYQKKKHKKEK